MVRLPARLRPLFPYLKPGYVAATRLVAPAMQRISRGCGGHLPTGAVDTLEQAAESSDGRAVVARPAEVLRRPAMQGFPAGLQPADDSDGEHLGRVAVAELPGGRVLGRHRAVITGRGDLVQEVSRYFGTSRAREHPLFLNPAPGPPLDFAGRLGVLAARGDANYYHFLFDVLPRIDVLERCPQIAAPDRWYVPTQLRFQLELLDLLGIGPDRRIDASNHPHVRASCLVVPGLPAMTEKNPPWVVEFLRRRLLFDLGGPPQRVYITRGTAAHNRAVRNEPEVLDLLRRRGFTAVDPGALSVAEQIRTFANASVVVAPHGAALANLAFAAPGAAVVELFPAGCVLPDFWRLACGVPGLRYRYLSAAGGPSRPNRARTIVRDIVVDLPALSCLLDDLV